MYDDNFLGSNTRNSDDDPKYALPSRAVLCLSIMPESTGLHTCGCWSINAVVTMLSVIVKAVLHPTQSFEERLSSLPSCRI